jgi:hypothetical protein
MIKKRHTPLPQVPITTPQEIDMSTHAGNIDIAKIKQ